MKSLCRHIAETYWPHMTAEQVQEMAEGDTLTATGIKEALRISLE